MRVKIWILLTIILFVSGCYLWKISAGKDINSKITTDDIIGQYIGERDETSKQVCEKALIIVQKLALEKFHLNISKDLIEDYYNNEKTSTDSLDFVTKRILDKLREETLKAKHIVWEKNIIAKSIIGQEKLFRYSVVLNSDSIKINVIDRIISEYDNKITKNYVEVENYKKQDDFINVIKSYNKIYKLSNNLLCIFGSGHDSSIRWIDNIENISDNIEMFLKRFEFNPANRQIYAENNEQLNREISIKLLYNKINEIRFADLYIEYNSDNILLDIQKNIVSTDKNGSFSFFITKIISAEENNKILIKPYFPDLDKMFDKFYNKCNTCIITLFNDGTPEGPNDPVKMVIIPGGRFKMGSLPTDKSADPDEFPPRMIILDDFWIDEHEVTNYQYRKFLDDNPNHPEPKYWFDSRFNDDEQPVVGVSWQDATSYCIWAGKRLPTEAEWEKAARGVDGRIYPWGNEFISNNVASSFNTTRPSICGIYYLGKSIYNAIDMSGNVWEWCSDWYNEETYKNNKIDDHNPIGPSSGTKRVIRGGSWRTGNEELRCANRMYLQPNLRTNSVGFRCVSDHPFNN